MVAFTGSRILVNLLFVLVYTVIYALSYLSNKKIEDKENE